MPATATCACTDAELTRVRFSHDVVLLRCVRHESQAWTVGGRPATSARAHGLLRELFVEGRSRRGGRRRPAPRQLVQLPPPARTSAPAPVAVPAPAPAAMPAATGQALTALLNARGLQGSWAVA